MDFSNDFPAAPREPQTALCPICQQLFPVADIDQHVEVCLSGGGQASQKKAAATPPSQVSTQNVPQWAQMTALSLERVLCDPHACQLRDLEMLEAALAGHVAQIQQQRAMQGM